MSKLSRYLVWQYSREALALFLVLVFLVWITQALRLFDLVTAKGQDIFTLAGQAFLTTPPLARAIIAITMGIAISRIMRSMLVSRELHTIHTTGRTKALWGSFVLFAIAGALVVTLIANWIEPVAKRGFGEWSERVAADLVGRALDPGQFREITPGFIVEIGGRETDGTIINFFADDSRDPDARRTYQAQKATVSLGDDGYFLSLRDGSLQIFEDGLSFSEVNFSRYELALDRITQSTTQRSLLDETTSFTLLKALQTRPLTVSERGAIDRRIAETFRVFSLCLFVAVLTAFPHARRSKKRIPLEMVVIAVALSDRVASGIVPLTPLGNSIGAAFLFAISACILSYRLYANRLPRFTRATA